MFFAYIDPGTGSMLVSSAGGMIGVVIGAVVAGFVTVGVFFRTALSSSFQRIVGIFKKK